MHAKFAATTFAAIALATVGLTVTPASADASPAIKAGSSETPAQSPVPFKSGVDDPSVLPFGWNGKCHTNWATSTQANLWCDGKGPERYGASIVCTKGKKTKQINYNNGPWFGDRRGITMTCPSGWKRAHQWGWPAN